MFYTVKRKVDQLLADGYVTRYGSAQIAWERLRAGEPVLFKLIKDDRVVRQCLAEPGKVGVHFCLIPPEHDFCRFHEEPIKKEEGEE